MIATGRKPESPKAANDRKRGGRLARKDGGRTDHPGRGDAHWIEHADLKKGARENMKSVAVRDLLGLRGRSPDELAGLGLNLAQVGSAQFQNNKAGPGEVPVFAFGKCKGKAANDPSVTLADLTWYAERCKESLADPEKAKWKKSEEKKLAAYRAEYERRVAESKAPKTAQPADPVSSEEFDRETGEVREPGDDGR